MKRQVNGVSTKFSKADFVKWRESFEQKLGHPLTEVSFGPLVQYQTSPGIFVAVRVKHSSRTAYFVRNEVA